MSSSVQNIGGIIAQYIDAIKDQITKVTSEEGSLCHIEQKCHELASRIYRELQIHSGQPSQENFFSEFTRTIKTYDFPSTLGSSFTKVQETFEKVQACLTGKTRRVDLEKRWATLGLPVEVLDGPWECIETLFSSGAAYAMSAFLRLSPESQLIRVPPETKELEVLFEGHFLSWTQFSKRYTWSKARDAFIGGLDSVEELSLTSAPNGFIRKSRYTYDEPFPTAILNGEQLRAVQTQAAKYNDSTEPPYAVLQVFTSPGGFSGPDWLCKAFAETGNVPSHCGIRVISNKGEVFTFGYMMDPKEETTWASPLRLASTVKACIGMIDYDEFRRFGSRYVTSLPLTSESFERVMNGLKEKQRSNDAVFNFGRENCASFSAWVLERAGYTLPDLRVSVSRFFGGLIVAPILHLPVVGKVIRSVAGFFSSFFSKAKGIEKRICSLPPLRPIVAPLNYVAQRVEAMVKWVISYCMGGTKISPYVTRVVGSRARPFLSISDIFKVGATDMVSSEGLLAWMQQQKSTREYRYRGPELTIL